MKLQFLPARQRENDDKAIQWLRRIGYVIFALLLCTLALGTWFYVWPPPVQTSPQLTSEDGQTSVEVVVLAPDLVLAPGKIGQSAEFSSPGEHKKASRVGSAHLPDGTELTLLRLESSTSVAPVSPVVTEAGDSLYASSSGQEWQGAARKEPDGRVLLDPDFTLSAGTPVYKDKEKTSIAGFAAHTGPGWVLVPVQEVRRQFPALTGGQ